MSINVMLVDDHPIVLQGIESVLSLERDIQVVAKASNGREAIVLEKKHNIDIIVMDISLPGLNGLEATKKVLKQNKNVKVLILSMHENRVFIEKALSYGAVGYVLKESASEEIIHAIREVFSGRYFLSAKISSFVIQDFISHKHKSLKLRSISILTSREREILQLIVEGMSNKEVAQSLNISLKTALVHRNNIMHKLDMHNEAQLVRFALAEGISGPLP